MWMPGVSIKTICDEGLCNTPRIRLRVVWGFFEVIEIFSPSIRFKSVDFPAFGAPAIAMKPDLKPLYMLLSAFVIIIGSGRTQSPPLHILKDMLQGLWLKKLVVIPTPYTLYHLLKTLFIPQSLLSSVSISVLRTQTSVLCFFPYPASRIRAHRLSHHYEL